MRVAVSRGSRALSLILLLFLITKGGWGYSVLSHEAIVDALWDVRVKPVLLARFPNATPEELKIAHGYAYGGAIIQDLGYYPHGSMKFSDLTHYVRTGDFILALIFEARDLNQLAFALGALSHYVSDLDGHRFATNRAEPLLYPKLAHRYGDYITYEDNPVGHLKTEFGFDVLQVAKGNFAPQAYHDFIGFYVATDVLRRAFHDTYGLELQDVFSNFDRAVESYRRAVSKTIPKATRVAWAARRNDIQRSEPGITRRRFVYVISRSSYERNWGKRYERPSTGERILAVILKLVPPIGPLRALQFKMPTPEVETLFMQSFDRSARQYHGTLDDVQNNDLHLANENYDVGVATRPGEYRMEDDVRAFWLDRLARKSFAGLTPPIREELLNYYSDLGAPISTKKNEKQWRRMLAELEELKVAKPEAAVANQP